MTTTHTTESVLAEFGPADSDGDHVHWSVRAHNLASALADARNTIAARDAYKHPSELNPQQRNAEFTDG